MRRTESRLSSKPGTFIMSMMTTGVGLISGINTGEIIDALINAQRASVARLESRQKTTKVLNSGSRRWRRPPVGEDVGRFAQQDDDLRQLRRE